MFYKLWLTLNILCDLFTCFIIFYAAQKNKSVANTECQIESHTGMHSNKMATTKIGTNP